MKNKIINKNSDIFDIISKNFYQLKTITLSNNKLNTKINTETMARHDIYCKCGPCRKRRSILGDAQTLTNRTQTIPAQALNPYELDKAYGYFPEDGTYDEWRRTLKGEPGEDGAGIEIKGNVDTYADLLAIPDPQIGDSYAVLGTGPDAQALLYTYGESGWPAEGKGIPIQGTPGEPGEPGADGTDGDTYIPMFADEFNQVNN